MKCSILRDEIVVPWCRNGPGIIRSCWTRWIQRGSPCFVRGTSKWGPKELKNFLRMDLLTFEVLQEFQVNWPSENNSLKNMKQVSRNRTVSYSMKQFHETPKISWNVFLERTHHETTVLNTEFYTNVSSCVPGFKNLRYRFPVWFGIKKMSQCMRFPTMWCVRPAKPQISLRIRAVWSEPLLVAWVFYNCEATDWTPFGVSKRKSRRHRLIWVYTCQNATLLEISGTGSNVTLSYLFPVWFGIKIMSGGTLKSSTFQTITWLFALCKLGNFNIHIWMWLGYFIW